MKNVAKKIYEELQQDGSYPVRVFHGCQVFAQLYENHPHIDDPTLAPNISMTCDTEKDIWIVTVTEAPLIPKAKIASAINEKCPWLTSHTYTCEYKALFNCRYLVITIGLDDDLCRTFVDRLKSIDLMLRELLELPATGS